MEDHEEERSIIQTELSLVESAAAARAGTTSTASSSTNANATQNQAPAAVKAPDYSEDGFRDQSKQSFLEDTGGVSSKCAAAAAAPSSDCGGDTASSHSRSLPHNSSISSNPASSHSRSTRAERMPGLDVNEAIIKGELSRLETTAGTGTNAAASAAPPPAAAAAASRQDTTKDADIEYLDRVNGTIDSFKSDIEAGILPLGFNENYNNNNNIDHGRARNRSSFGMVGAFAVNGEGIEDNRRFDEERTYRSRPQTRQQPLNEQSEHVAEQPLHEAGLAIAQPVHEHEHEHFPTAIPEQIDGAPGGDDAMASKRWSPCNGFRSFALTFGILVIVIAIILAAVLGSNSSENNELPLNPMVNPSAFERMTLWMPDYTKDAIGTDPFSPQALAYNWTIADPSLEDYPDWRIRQRFVLATLYYATGGLHHWVNDDGWLSYDRHECYWYSYTSFNNSALVVSELPYFHELVARYSELSGDQYNLQNPCHEDPNSSVIPEGGGRYQILSFIMNGLQGTLPRELYLLDTLKSIVIFDDVQAELTADIQNLPSLISLALPSTTGTIPSEVGLLSNLLMLTFVPLVGGADEHRSELSGSLPTELGNLSNLMHFSMEKNSITGPIPSEMGRLSDLLEFIISQSGKYRYYVLNLYFLPLLTSY